MTLQEHLSRLMGEDEERGTGSFADAAYFEAQPKRRYRMRLATPAEIEAMDLANGLAPLGKGSFRWVVVCQFAPGMRIRVHINAPLPPGPIADIPEHVARDTFECAALAAPEQVADLTEFFALLKSRDK